MIKKFDVITAEHFFKEKRNRDAVAETGKRIYEREKSELKSHLNSPAPEHQLSKIKEMADNNNKAAQDYIDNYNECVELNNNNSLSVEQLKEFNNTYSSSNLGKKPNSALDDYKNKLSLQSNRMTNATNNKPYGLPYEKPKMDLVGFNKIDVMTTSSLDDWTTDEEENDSVSEIAREFYESISNSDNPLIENIFGNVVDPVSDFSEDLAENPYGVAASHKLLMVENDLINDDEKGMEK